MHELCHNPNGHQPADRSYTIYVFLLKELRMARLAQMPQESSRKPMLWWGVVALAAGFTGWLVPEMYESTNLDQSSDVDSSVFTRATLASVLVLFATLIGWFVWHRFRSGWQEEGKAGQGKAGQFGTRTVFSSTAAVAMAAGAWRISKVPAEFWFVGTYVAMVVTGLIVGRATYLAGSHPSMESKDSRRVWKILLGGLAFVAVLIAVTWWFEFEYELAGIVWMVVFGFALRHAPRSVRIRNYCYLAAIYLPYVWLTRWKWMFRQCDGLDDLTKAVSFMAHAPAIVPAAIINHSPDSLFLASVVLVVVSLIGLGLAYWGRRPIAVFAGLAIAASLFGSFGLNALFRA